MPRSFSAPPQAATPATPGESAPAPRTNLRTKLITSLARAASAGSQSGLSLIEVLISALLVGVIAIGTLTAFDTAGRASQDQRNHAQANQLAQQDEERLRSLTTTELTTMTSAAQPTQLEAENGLCVKEISGGKWEYCSTTAFKGEPYLGTVFHVTSSAQFVSAATNELSCKSSSGATSYIQTTSTVRWETLLSKRPSVTQSSIVTDPATGLIVKVINQNHEPVEGAAVTVKGTSPAFSSVQTTPAAGCVVVTGITNTEVEVAVTKLSFVDLAGKSPPAVAHPKITAGTTTPVEFVIAEPGSIEAEFVSEIGGVTTGTEGETFFAKQNSIVPPPENFVFGTDGTPVKTGLLKPVFPFAEIAEPHEPEAYTVYAGDCEANNPETVNPLVKLTANNKALVKPGAVAKVKLEVPAVNVVLYNHTETEEKAGKTEKLEKAETAEIYNSGCPAAPAAQNQSTLTNKHAVTVTSAGGITPKYQPYAKKLELCVIAEIGAGKFWRFLHPFEHKEKAGITITGYMTNTTPVAEYEKATTKGKLKCP